MNNFMDNTQTFVVRKMLEGIKRSSGHQCDNRLPITKEMLKRIILSLPCVCKSSYESKLFSSVFSLCFHAFLRVGEVAFSNNCGKHVLQYRNVQLFQGHIELLLVSSKTDQTGVGTTVFVEAGNDKLVCPLALLQSYLHDRPPYDGPLFCHYDGRPLSRYQISSVLTKSLRILGVDSTMYSTHSLRIGAATCCALEGVPDAKFMEYGRWKTHTAFKTYIRISS